MSFIPNQSPQWTYYLLYPDYGIRKHFEYHVAQNNILVEWITLILLDKVVSISEKKDAYVLNAVPCKRITKVFIYSSFLYREHL